MPPNEQESPGAADTYFEMGGQMTPVSLPLTKFEGGPPADNSFIFTGYETLNTALDVIPSATTYDNYELRPRRTYSPQGDTTSMIAAALMLRYTDPRQAAPPSWPVHRHAPPARATMLGALHVP